MFSICPIGVLMINGYSEQDPEAALNEALRRLAKALVDRRIRRMIKGSDAPQPQRQHHHPDERAEVGNPSSQPAGGDYNRIKFIHQLLGNKNFHETAQVVSEIESIVRRRQQETQQQNRQPKEEERPVYTVIPDPGKQVSQHQKLRIVLERAPLRLLPIIDIKSMVDSAKDDLQEYREWATLSALHHQVPADGGETKNNAIGGRGEVDINIIADEEEEDVIKAHGRQPKRVRTV